MGYSKGGVGMLAVGWRWEGGWWVEGAFIGMMSVEREDGLLY